MADFAIYESLSREERLRRIGALFCKALALVSVPRESLMGTQSVALPASVGSAATEGLAGTESLREEDCALLKPFAPLGEFSSTIPARTGLTPQPEVTSYLHDSLGQIVTEANPKGIRTCRT